MISPYKTGVPASIFPWPPIHSYPFSPVTRPRPGELALPSEGLQVLSGAKVGGVMWAALMSGSVGHLSPAGSVQKSKMYDDVHGFTSKITQASIILWLYPVGFFVMPYFQAMGCHIHQPPGRVMPHPSLRRAMVTCSRMGHGFWAGQWCDPLLLTAKYTKHTNMSLDYVSI